MSIGLPLCRPWTSFGNGEALSASVPYLRWLDSAALPLALEEDGFDRPRIQQADLARLEREEELRGFGSEIRKVLLELPVRLVELAHGDTRKDEARIHLQGVAHGQKDLEAVSARGALYLTQMRLAAAYDSTQLGLGKALGVAGIAETPTDVAPPLLETFLLSLL